MSVPAGSTSPETPRVLVAGVGNIFLSDDGFGVEAVRQLRAEQGLPDGVETVDTGVRGVHLAYQLLDGYHTVVLVDATQRGGEPGTVYLIDASQSAVAKPQDALVDGHRMTPDTVLRLLETLCAGTGGSRPGRILVVGCEPGCLDEGIGLSEPVAAAVERALTVVLDVLHGRTDGAGRSPQLPVEPADSADRAAVRR